MSKIVLTRGLPASGKSTFAKEWVAEAPSERIRVNRDGIRWTQGAFPFGTPEQEEMVTVIEEGIILAAIKAGKDAIIDATNLNPRYTRKWFKLARLNGVREVEIIDFEVPIAELIERDASREKSVGQGVIAKLAKRWKIDDDGKLPKAPKWDSNDWPDLTPAAEWSPHLPSAIIVDTDGTLANHEGIRSPYDTSRYHLDTLHSNVARAIWSLEPNYDIIAVSGRDAKYADVTRLWWKQVAAIEPTEMHFRPEGDTRPDDVIKAEIYEKHIRGRYNVVGVFDDRGRVLRMWRAKGLTTFAVGDTDNNNF
ncbi:polynucleotide kinase [Microbacterium phage Jacko]|nr:polynucleotide kinase [Microbacterium phage Jacko]